MNTSTEPRPQQCTLDPTRGLMYVKWQDGHESLIPLTTVRYHCPCATCREQRRRADADDLTEIFAGANTEPTSAQPAGNYALRISWADGHASGIYTWEYLRRMCPCEECVKKRTTTE